MSCRKIYLYVRIHDLIFNVFIIFNTGGESMEEKTENVKDTDLSLSPFYFDFESQWGRINEGMEIDPQLDCKYFLK